MLESRMDRRLRGNTVNEAPMFSRGLRLGRELEVEARSGLLTQPVYSARNVMAGSTRAARQAGVQQATAATVASSVITLR